MNVLTDKRDQGTRVLADHDLTGTAGRFVAGAGLVYLVAIVIDLGILWLGQRQDGPNFMFVALTRTAEAFPRFILGTALVYAGLALTRSASLALYRALAAWVLVLGTVALILVALTAMNYLGMSSAVIPEAQDVFRSAVIKTGGLGLLYVMFLIPLGILGFRTRRR